MLYLILFIISFIILFINRFVKIKKKKLKKSMDLELFIYWNNIKNINNKKSSLILVFINSIIITLTVAVSKTFEFGYVWQVLTALGFMYVFMYSLYQLLGLFLERRDKNEKYKRN